MLPSVGKKRCLHLVMASAPTQWMLSVVCMPSAVKKSVYAVVAVGSSAGVTRLRITDVNIRFSNEETRFRELLCHSRIEKGLELGLHAGLRIVVCKVNRRDEAGGQQGGEGKGELHLEIMMCKQFGPKKKKKE